MIRTSTLTAIFLVLAGATGAQEPVTLTLDQAVALATENNPDYRAARNDVGVADWRVRSAYADFIPSASVGGGLSYQGGGSARIGGFTSGDIGLGETPSYYYSSFNASVGLTLSGSKVYEIGRQRASRRAVLANLDVAAQTLEANVTRQYLAVLRSEDAVDLAVAELERAEANLALAEARQAVESATSIEVKQAEVERGRAEVGLLQARTALDNQRTRLSQLLGVELDGDVTLTSDVAVFEPAWELRTLIETALASQPELEAARATRQSAESGVGMARSAYWPSLSISTGLSGYTRRVGDDEYLIEQAYSSILSQRRQCAQLNEIYTRLDPPIDPVNCFAQYQLTPEMQDQILAQNRQFPFDFTTEPVSVSLSVSVPIFQGLNRQAQLESAHAAADDARLRVRAEELRIRADVETAYRNLRSAYRSVQLEERNRELADDQLRLARERYRVGAASFLELMEAEALKARADREYLLGVYTFQESLTTLEAAVGHDLATPDN
ncbi:MAG: TolC family protein [Longimicrobiales bacterium]|nr:TolC family protein [Longimicrobiales bacterium]